MFFTVVCCLHERIRYVVDQITQHIDRAKYLIAIQASIGLQSHSNVNEMKGIAFDQAVDQRAE
jgi:hypothetical protein